MDIGILIVIIIFSIAVLLGLFALGGGIYKGIIELILIGLCVAIPFSIFIYHLFPSLYLKHEYCESEFRKEAYQLCLNITERSTYEAWARSKDEKLKQTQKQALEVFRKE